MRIVDIRERPVAISRYRDPSIPSGGLTTSIVAVTTDVMRDGRPVVGYGFASIGRFAQSGLIRERFAPRLLSASDPDIANSDGTNLDPIQEIGIRNMAADCGYCTAGWLTVAKTFLEKNPNPTEDEIKDVLAGHLCRCSAYAGIIKTVKDTASYMRGEATL